MPVGTSGRIVIEIDPELKQLLHQSLKSDGLNMKDWFLKCAEEYLRSKSQQQVMFDKLGRPIRRANQ